MKLSDKSRLDKIGRRLLKSTGHRDLETGHRVVAQCLRNYGITHVFTLAGTPIVETLVACRQQQIRTVDMHHQQAAVFAALAMNYLSGKLRAAVLLSAGPAITNAMTGLLVAHDNCWPVLVIGGRRSLDFHDKGVFQDLDALPLLRSITKYAHTVSRQPDIPDAIFTAIQRAMTDRPGPTYLDIVEDALQMKSERQVKVPGAREQARRLSTDSEQLEQMLDCLSLSRRPLLILGKGLRWTAPVQSLAQLVDRLRLPFVTMPMARGILPDDHSLCCNRIINQVQADADFILILGARKNWLLRYGVHFSATAKIAQVDIHQAELSVDENVEFPIHADLGEFLQQWQLAIQARSSSGDDHANRREWVKIIGNCPINSNARNSVTAQGRYGQLLPQAVIERLAEIIPATAICILDGNLSMQMAQRHLTARYPFRWLNAGSSGCMGIGTPYAIGAKMTCPSEPVIVITGDMAFGLNAMEIETAVRTDTHLIVIIINNHGSMGNPHDSLIHAEDNQDKAIEYQPDLAYEKLAMALGAEGEVVDCLSGVQTALENALNTARTCCINILVDASAGL